MKRNMRSLEETINLRIIFMGLFSLLLTSIVLISAFHTRYQALITDSLHAYASMLAADASPETLSEIDTGDYRVTLIASDGDVLYDSLADEQTQENHADRSEIIAATASGHGEAVRKSETMGYNTHYYAVRLDTGDVLRVSAEVVNTAALFGDALPLVGLAVLVIVAASVLLSILLSKRLIRSIRTTVLNPDAIDGAPYAELAPLAEAVSSQRSRDRENERMRREFTANVSHELKTPLTSIKGYAEMIESGMAKQEDVQIFARRIRDESERMVTLIRDIVELSELDEGRTAEAFRPLDIGALSRDTAELLRFEAERRGISLDIRTVPSMVLGSRTMLEELVYNLCDNALRYNRQGGRVDVQIEKTQDFAVLTVSDTGIGIPAEHQSRIFERFYRVDKSRSRQTGGTGLGLAIVKHIATLHSAAISVDSAPGEGTVMTVRFPLLTEQDKSA